MSAETANHYNIRLKKLRIQSFRGIDSLDLDFTGADGEPLDQVVFGGDNGSGKTTVLEAILLISKYQDGMRWLTGSRDLETQVFFGSSAMELHGEFEARSPHDPNPISLEFQLDHDEFIRGKEFPIKPTLKRYGPNPADPDAFRRRRDAKPVVEVEYFSSRRQPALLEVELGDKKRQRQEKIESGRLLDLRQRLISAYYRYLRQGVGTNGPFARLQKMWETFHGGAHQIDVIPVDNNPGSGDEVVIREPRPIPEDITSLAMARALSPSRGDIPWMVPLHQLSSGQVALLSFAGPLIFRDRPVDIVVIDEPEQHLHVQWQRLILLALRDLAPQAQFFVATHSLEILDSALSYERFILAKSGDPRPSAQEMYVENGEAATE